MTTIRLPLQIGTSSLWSVARSSTFFPGAALIVLGVYSFIELIDLDSIGWGIGIALVVGGVALIYYAYRHMRLALEERPSDVVVDEKGLRVEGGPRHGLSIAWNEIDAERCAVEAATDERLVLWRVIANIPLFAISVVGESSIVIDFSAKTPVKRLYVAKRGVHERMLFAEGELEVEQASLETLAATIRSSRWHKGKQRAPKKQKNPGAILCASCGASIAPTAQAQVMCAFCNHPVAIPKDVQERVAAAEILAKSRSVGFSHLSRLLESQPSALRAMIAITLAAIPILFAWPIAGFLAARVWEPTALFALHLGELMVFPILLTFAAFLLARGRMTDRFALHAVVVGFGAREPVRPGEPYRCRACEAALPPVSNTPIVRCVYCHQESVLGLDLRADASEAAQEHHSLEKALSARTRERWLWTVGSVVAVGLLALSWFAIRPSLHARVRTAAELAFSPPKKFEKGAPRFQPVGMHAKLVSMTGILPFDASSCDWYVAPSGKMDLPCRVRLVCSGADVFGDDTPRTCGFLGGKPSTFDDTIKTGDSDMRLIVNDTALITGHAHGSEYGAELSFDPRAHAISQTSPRVDDEHDAVFRRSHDARAR